MHRRIHHGLAALTLAAASTLALAAEHSTPREARAFFATRPSRYLQAKLTQKSWKAFNNRTGPFVKKDLYLYVIDTKGTYAPTVPPPSTWSA